MKKSILVVLSLVVIAAGGYFSLFAEDEKVEGYTYRTIESKTQLIIEVHYKLRNGNSSPRYAAIILENVLYQYIENPEAVKPIYLEGNSVLHGSTSITLDKSNMGSTLVEQIISKDTQPVQAISIGKRLKVD